ncbi:MAG: hypothetical protein U5M51_09655 [Emticicia sp.]|nr:hypothetical protein [Emticicia sp.]
MMYLAPDTPVTPLCRIGKTTVLKEWALYLAIFREKPQIAEIHLGGGTPSFFAPETLRTLIEGILKNADHKPRTRI